MHILRFSIQGQLAALTLTTGLLFPAAGLTQVAARTEYKVGDSVEISLPKGWSVPSAEELQRIERGRDQMAKNQGIAVPRVETLTARRVDSSGTATLGAMIMAAEASQAEIRKLTPAQIKTLGEGYSSSFTAVLRRGGASEIEFGPTALEDVGGKLAISQALSYRDPNGVKQAGVRYHIYMRNATIILHEYAAINVSKALRDEATAAIKSARLIER
ncbi:hypothetical protein [Variovorax paradoxus]|jgi:hypothetical protein|uniref:hypothetical protein n=1 Tax=Variovorax paradoxus TaxID=34073 RepID=UPI00155EB6F4